MAATAIAVLGAGIGATAALRAVVSAALLEPLAAAGMRGATELAPGRVSKTSG